MTHGRRHRLEPMWVLPYTQATKRRERLAGAHLKAYDRAIGWARMGTNPESGRVLATAEATKDRT